METQKIIVFEILMQYFDITFDYNFQEGPNINLLSINGLQSKYGISIDQTDHITKKKISNIGDQRQKMK